MFFGCCAIIPPLKRAQNVAVAEGTPQNQPAKDSGLLIGWGLR